MTYKDFSRTFQILGQYQKEGINSRCQEVWAANDEFGIEVDFSIMSKDDIAELVEMGWRIGCDGDSPDVEMWDEVFDDATKKVIDKIALYKLVQSYDSIYSY